MHSISNVNDVLITRRHPVVGDECPDEAFQKRMQSAFYLTAGSTGHPSRKLHSDRAAHSLHCLLKGKFPLHHRLTAVLGIII